MTVKEFIEQLSLLDPNLEVCYPTEGSFTDPVQFLDLGRRCPHTTDWDFARETDLPVNAVRIS